MKQIRLILMILTLSAASPARGQEWTLEFSSPLSDTSIVRCHGSKMLVYNHYLDFSRPSNYFFFLSEYTTIADAMEYYGAGNDIDSVADMEIVGDTVYFCGRRSTGNNLVGFIGYFDITSFPNATATVYQLPQYACINKLTFTTFSNQSTSCYHLMMIGTKPSGASSLIDVALTPTWTFAVYDGGDDVFLDVDQTKNFVIVTSRYDRNDGHVWAFPKTVPTGNYFFDSPNIQRAQRPSTYAYPYLIEPTMDSDNYFITSQPDASAPLYISTFNGTTFNHTYRPTTSGHVVRDMNYNPTSNMLDVVVDIVSTGHAILHIPQLFYPVGGIYTKIFSSHIPAFHSIDNRPVGTGWFAVTGKNNASNLGLFLYDPQGGGDCSVKTESMCIMSNEPWYFNWFRTEKYIVTPVIVTLEPDIKEYQVRKICVSKTENQ